MVGNFKGPKITEGWLNKYMAIYPYVLFDFVDFFLMPTPF